MRRAPAALNPRRFGLGTAAVLVTIGGFFVFRGGRAWPAGFVVAGLLTAAAALAVPRLLLPLCRAWMGLARALGWLNTRLLLTLVFFLMITPIGLLMRVFGHDPMDRRWRRPGRNSYWGGRPVDCRSDLRRTY